jgi:hypothetical protein
MTSSVLGTDIKTGQRVELHKSTRTQGTGESGLIENLIVQDMKQGFGVCVLDPHGELIEHIIARLDARREPDGRNR